MSDTVQEHTTHRSTSVHKVNSTLGPTPHTVQQHILLTLKRGKVSTVRNKQCSLIHHDVIHLSYPPTPPHTTSLITLLIHSPEDRRTLRDTTHFNYRTNYSHSIIIFGGTYFTFQATFNDGTISTNTCCLNLSFCASVVKLVCISPSIISLLVV